jgi:hypothetical protein
MLWGGIVPDPPEKPEGYRNYLRYPVVAPSDLLRIPVSPESGTRRLTRESYQVVLFRARGHELAAHQVSLLLEGNFSQQRSLDLRGPAQHSQLD